MRLVAVCLLAVALGGASLAACSGSDVDSATRALLAEHGLRATGPTSTTRITVGQQLDAPWEEYRAASAAIGLTDWQPVGTVVELRTTPIASTLPGVRVHVIVLAGAPVGAWQSTEGGAPAIHTLDERL